MYRRKFNRLLALSAFSSTLVLEQEAIAQPLRGKSTLKIKLSSVLVDDQERALKFYTEVLGFVKKTEIPMGEFKWLTVVSPEEPENIELVLEPLGFPPAKTYQKALFEAGIPLTAFAVDDIQEEYERMSKLGVEFRGEPTKTGLVTTILFEDTCGTSFNSIRFDPLTLTTAFG